MQPPRPLFAWLLVLCPIAAGAAPVVTTRGLVAAAHPLAAEAGAVMLRAGGTAADAAAATAFALAVVEPGSSGLGGGGFALLRCGSDTLFLDFREVAPRRARREMFLRDGTPAPELSRDGPLAVAVPGAVAGYLEVARRCGKLPPATLIAPALRLARDGFVIDEQLRGALAARYDQLAADPEAARIFLLPGADGRPAIPPVGHRLLQPDLAWTLERIAEGGAAAFYRGPVAARLVADMRARRGLLQAADLEAYRVRERPPLWGSFGGRAVATAPLPSSGGVILLTLLNVIDQGPGYRWRTPESVHLYVEASKRAFADRQLLGDPAFAGDLTARLLAKDRALLLHQLIGASPRATPAGDVPPGQGAQLPPPPRRAAPRREAEHTTHLSVIDAAGDAVAMTTTINWIFGAAIVARGTGVVWNDEMDDFAVAPGVPNVFGVVGAEANAVAPGKVPLSSMSPTLVLAGPQPDAPVRLVVGSPGGPRIPTTVAQVIVNHLVHGMDIAQAIAAPRLHHQHLPDLLLAEPWALEPLTHAELTARGHAIELRPPWSNATAISVDPATGVRAGAADPRGVGAAVAE